MKKNLILLWFFFGTTLGLSSEINVDEDGCRLPNSCADYMLSREAEMQPLRQEIFCLEKQVASAKNRDLLLKNLKIKPKTWIEDIKIELHQVLDKYYQDKNILTPDSDIDDIVQAYQAVYYADLLLKVIDSRLDTFGKALSLNKISLQGLILEGAILKNKVNKGALSKKDVLDIIKNQESLLEFYWMFLLLKQEKIQYVINLKITVDFLKRPPKAKL